MPHRICQGPAIRYHPWNFPVCIAVPQTLEPQHLTGKPSWVDIKENANGQKTVSQLQKSYRSETFPQFKQQQKMCPVISIISGNTHLNLQYILSQTIKDQQELSFRSTWGHLRPQKRPSQEGRGSVCGCGHVNVCTLRCVLCIYGEPWKFLTLKCYTSLISCLSF